MRAWVFGLAAAATCASVIAQPEKEPGDGAPTQQIRLQDLPPALRLGIRSDSIRRQTGVIPSVVIVPDASSYVRALSAWDTVVRDAKEGDASSGKVIGARFPVLIDDGSWRAREDIARFVRAFEPKQVVRWSADAPWPKEADAARALIESCVATVWGAPNVKALPARWAELGFAPPGIVAASLDDPAWTAALALAAGRGQLIAWVESRRDLSGSMTLEEAMRLNTSIMDVCRAAGVPFESIGDAVDAVTLCTSTPASIRLPDGDQRKMLATTDVIGRGSGGDAERRWAWAAQIPGAEPRAAYMAMCALFLQPNSAWVFDGYTPAAPRTENGKTVQDPRSLWDGSPAAITLEKAGIPTLLNDNGNQGAPDWRNRAAGMGLTLNDDATREGAAGVNAGLIAVNTSGHPEQFDVSPGQLRSSDVPFLHVPSLVHFVHSFSAARPGDRATIAGRFLERGASAYVGAVHEPFLQAFVPTPRLPDRLLAQGPWAAAVRLDDAPTWKVAVFGDALFTIGPAAPRLATELPLANAVPLRDALAPALKDKKYADALWLLALQGRDADAARLARVVEKDDAAGVTDEVALAAIASVFRSPGRDGAAGTGERLSLLAALAHRLEKKYNDLPELRDLLWHAAFPSLAKLTPEQVRALAGAIRPEQASRDAQELVGGARVSLGNARAAQLLRQAKPDLPQYAASAIEDALGKQ